MNNNQLPSAIPHLDQYWKLLESEQFIEMENYSNRFLESNKYFLKSYSKNWVADPLHNWSRIWEYPYVYSKIEDCLMTINGKVRILDAGSGITFFPYYIKSCYPTSMVFCCDCEENLEDSFNKVNSIQDYPVNFSVALLEDTKFPDDYFNIVYCISVIEHTNQYQKIIDELYRIIIPGGMLIISFDISIDKKGELKPREVTKLLIHLNNKFNKYDKKIYQIDTMLSRPDILTTQSIYLKNRDLLPWSHPSIAHHIKSIIRGKGLISYPPLYTVYCLSIAKK
jgi:2-polyprenyl-3-methyl-5-hydroxy-6-metoxy-1,4-benzoquinol methylase